jgi:hypothetical protein
MSPIRARSRRPTTVDVSMLSSSARFRWIEHRRLPGRHDVPGPAHRRGRVDRHDLAGDQPVEQVTDRGQPLLDARRRELARAGFNPGGDVRRLDGADRRHADARAPGQEFIGGAGIGATRVRVADVGCENSRKRVPARSPAAATSAGSEGEVIGTSWFMASSHRPELSQGDEFHA